MKGPDRKRSGPFGVPGDMSDQTHHATSPRRGCDEGWGNRQGRVEGLLLDQLPVDAGAAGRHTVPPGTAMLRGAPALMPP